MNGHRPVQYSPRCRLRKTRVKPPHVPCTLTKNKTIPVLQSVIRAAATGAWFLGVPYLPISCRKISTAEAGAEYEMRSYLGTGVAMQDIRTISSLPSLKAKIPILITMLEGPSHHSSQDTGKEADVGASPLQYLRNGN